MQNLFNDEELELFVSQKFETSFFMTIFSSRNFFFFFRTISHFSEFKKADDSTQKIKQLNSETKKTKANKFSIDELTKMQTKEQKIKTFFSRSQIFLLLSKKTTSTIDLHSRNFLKSTKQQKTQSTQTQTAKKESKTNHKIHNRNERSRAQKTQRRNKRHTRIFLSNSFYRQILNLRLTLLLLKTTTN
jgi:hypothetical protein